MTNKNAMIIIIAMIMIFILYHRDHQVDVVDGEKIDNDNRCHHGNADGGDGCDDGDRS